MLHYLLLSALIAILNALHVTHTELRLQPLIQGKTGMIISITLPSNLPAPFLIQTSHMPNLDKKILLAYTKRYTSNHDLVMDLIVPVVDAKVSYFLGFSDNEPEKSGIFISSPFEFLDPYNSETSYILQRNDFVADRKVWDSKLPVFQQKRYSGKLERTVFEISPLSFRKGNVYTLHFQYYIDWINGGRMPRNLIIGSKKSKENPFDLYIYVLHPSEKIIKVPMKASSNSGPGKNILTIQFKIPNELSVGDIYYFNLKRSDGRVFATSDFTIEYAALDAPVRLLETEQEEIDKNAEKEDLETPLENTSDLKEEVVRLREEVKELKKQLNHFVGLMNTQRQVGFFKESHDMLLNEPKEKATKNQEDLILF